MTTRPRIGWLAAGLLVVCSGQALAVDADAKQSEIVIRIIEEAMIDAIGERIEGEGRAVDFGVSVGIALYPGDGATDGNGRFSDVSQVANLDLACFGMAAAWGDYDNDGDLDLYLAINQFVYIAYMKKCQVCV